MQDVGVIDEVRAATAVLDPLRAQMLAALVEPGSATTLAAALGEPRQKINYHLRTLEKHGLVELVEERPRRGLTERMMIASAESYVLSPDVLGDNAVDAERTDQLSTRYLLALAARLTREVHELTKAADAARKPLASMSIDTEIRFATADDRTAFAEDLANTVTALASRYHSEEAPDGRWHRLIIAVHPHPPSTQPKRTEQ